MGSYYPYGEAKSGTVSNADSFATYYRDSTGLDYAQNRYYVQGLGRFLTADPYVASSSLRNPTTWNRYSYVESDPANKKDPSGLFSVGTDYDELNWTYTLLSNPTPSADGDVNTLSAIPYIGLSRLALPGNFSYNCLDWTCSVLEATIPYEAYNALVGAGLVPLVPVLIRAGQVVVVVGAVICEALVQWTINNSTRNRQSDPIAYPRGPITSRDSETQECIRPPQYKWMVSGNTYGSTNGFHWHWMEFNQPDLTECVYYANRRAGKDDPGPNVILLVVP